MTGVFCTFVSMYKLIYEEFISDALPANWTTSCSSPKSGTWKKKLKLFNINEADSLIEMYEQVYEINDNPKLKFISLDKM